jgi:nucleoside diphosphate kinase
VANLSLTRNSRKHELFARDPFYRESCEDLIAVAGRQAEQVVARHGLVLLKPDATVRRKLCDAIDWLIGQGWTIRASAPIRFNRWMIRGMWGYQWKSADRGRRDIADLYLPVADSLLLALESPEDLASSEWACCVLTRLKGPFNVTACRPGTLRHDLGSLNRQLNLVHTADEPADLVRELGVCLDSDARRDIFAALLDGSDGSVQAIETATRLQDGSERVDLTLEGCLKEIEAALDHVPSQGQHATELRTLLPEIAAARSRDWRRVLDLADRTGLGLTTWQVVVLGTWLLPPTNGESPAPDPMAGGTRR